MNMFLMATALTVATPAAAQATDPHAGHGASAPMDKPMPAHDAMMADGKMKPDADMMERCEKMHAAMVAKADGAPKAK